MFSPYNPSVYPNVVFIHQMKLTNNVQLKVLTLALPVCLALASNALASVGGKMTFNVLGSPTTDTGDINTATSYDLPIVIMTTGSGEFAIVPPGSILTGVTFNVSDGASFSFSNPTIGDFTSASITEYGVSPGNVSYDILGTYSGGALFLSATPASFQISFAQNPADTGSIDGVATLSIPPIVVPEPASLALLTMSGLGGLLIVRRRK